VSRLEVVAKKAEVQEKGTQTHDPGQKSKEAQDDGAEKVSDSALSVQEVRKQFQSAITASGDDWSKYLTAFKN